MKTRFIACAVLVLSFFASLPVMADTPVPHGYAVYDLTLTMTEMPELNNYGDWPLQIDTLMGQTVIGERVSVDPAKTQIVYRAIMDIEAMMDYTTNSTYKTRSAHQMYFHLFTYYFNVYNSGYQNTGSWISFNGPMSFTDEERTIECFARKLTTWFEDRVCWVKADVGGSETKSTFKNLTIKRLYNVGTDPLPDAEKKYRVRCSFHQPLSTRGYQTVNKIAVTYPNFGTVTMLNPTVSDDGLHYEANVMMNVPAMIAKINSDEYQTSVLGNWQSHVAVYGTDENGAKKQETAFATGTNGKLAKISGDTECDLGIRLGGHIGYRDGGKNARIANFTILRPRKGLKLFMR